MRSSNDAGSRHARVVRAARALARDPLATATALDALTGVERASAVSTVALAGASGCGKTALARRLFADLTDHANARSVDWRASPTIGIDFASIEIELDAVDGAPRSRVRARVLDPSGARAHAPCRAAAYADADAVIAVFDPSHGGADATAIESVLREIADARARVARASPARVVLALSERSSVDVAPSRAIDGRHRERARARERDDDDDVATRVARAGRACGRRFDRHIALASHRASSVDASSLVTRVDASTGVGARDVFALALVDR